MSRAGWAVLVVCGGAVVGAACAGRPPPPPGPPPEYERPEVTPWGSASASAAGTGPEEPGDTEGEAAE
ncbi:MAG: hypothetical protein IT376_21355 [Polyangiaceae bacterium]|nr:hypothetical protein [Polyangiaceae bacterium]